MFGFGGVFSVALSWFDTGTIVVAVANGISSKGARNVDVIGFDCSIIPNGTFPASSFDETCSVFNYGMFVSVPVSTTISCCTFGEGGGGGGEALKWLLYNSKYILFKSSFDISSLFK